MGRFRAPTPAAAGARRHHGAAFSAWALLVVYGCGHSVSKRTEYVNIAIAAVLFVAATTTPWLLR